MIVCHVGSVRFAGAVHGQAFGAFDAGYEQWTVIQSKAGAAHHVQAQDDGGVGQHLSERFTVRAFHLQEAVHGGASGAPEGM